MLQKNIILLIIGSILVISLGTIFILSSYVDPEASSFNTRQGPDEANPGVSSESDSAELEIESSILPSQSVERVQDQSIYKGIQADIHYAPSPNNPFGKVKPVPASENKTVAAVHRAIQPATRDASQLTVMAEPKPFDLEAYKKNPESYTSLSVPARAFRPAQPAVGVPRIQRIGGGKLTIKQGDKVTLKVRAIAGHPVTFTSLDMGRFEGSQLTSETVVAGQSGVATVEFIGATGAIYDCDIQAASPTSSGTVRWVVHIQPTVDVFAEMNAQAEVAEEQIQNVEKN